MKKAIRRIGACVLFLAFAGCSSEQEEIYSQTMKAPSVIQENSADEVPSESSIPQASALPSTAVHPELTAELTLRTTTDLNTADLWETYIKQFNKYYPNIKIEICAEGSILDKGFQEQFTVKLLSGEAKDLVDLESTSAFRHAASGVLIQLDPFMEKAEGFSFDDYYTNVFDAVRYQGGLYYMPYEFDFMSVRLNKPLADRISFQAEGRSALGIPELLELCGKAKDLSEPSENFLVDSGVQWGFFNFLELSSYVNESNGTADLQSDEFLEYLKKLGDLRDESRDFRGYYGAVISRLDENQFCGIASMQITTEKMAKEYLAAEDSEEVTNCFQLETGKDEKIFDAHAIGITQSCKNQEAAFAFVRFLLENDMKLYEDDYLVRRLYPVNRKTNLEILTKIFGTEHQEVINQIDGWCSAVDTMTLLARNSELFDQLNDICEEYMDDLLSAEQCAEKLQGRAEIYLNE